MKRLTYREDHNHAEVVLLVPDKVAKHFRLPFDIKMSGRRAGRPFSFALTKIEEEVDDG
jgi:hypothetical protein